MGRRCLTPKRQSQIAGSVEGRRIAASSADPLLVHRARGGGHVRAAVRSRRSTPVTGDDAGISRRPAAAQQGRPVSGRSAQGRGDRRRHVRRWRRRARPSAARPACDPVAGRVAHPRGARLGRGRISIHAVARCSCAAARAGAAARSSWTLGAGPSCSPGSSCVSSCPSGRCSAFSAARRAVAIGRARPRARSCAGSPPPRACAAASPRIRSARLRWSNSGARIESRSVVS
jgi:hypothetical protein